MKTYKWLRGLLKASAFTTVMFVMQACYGSPYQRAEVLAHDYDDAVRDAKNCEDLKNAERISKHLTDLRNEQVNENDTVAMKKWQDLDEMVEKTTKNAKEKAEILGCNETAATESDQ